MKNGQKKTEKLLANLKLIKEIFMKHFQDD